MIEFGNASHGHMIMKLMNALYSPDIMTVIGRVVKDDIIGDEFLGGVVYENFTGKGGSIAVHFGGFHPKWMSRDLLWVGFHYPFVQLECNQIFARVRAKNAASRRVVENMGYEQVIILPDVWSDDDMVLYRMKKADCRFLNIKPHGLVYGRTNDDER